MQHTQNPRKRPFACFHSEEADAERQLYFDKLSGKVPMSPPSRKPDTPEKVVELLPLSYVIPDTPKIAYHPVVHGVVYFDKLNGKVPMSPPSSKPDTPEKVVKLLPLSYAIPEVDTSKIAHHPVVHGVVYFAFLARQGCFKVGCTTNLSRRMADLSKENGEALQVSGFIDTNDMYFLERAAHIMLQNRQTERRCEYFYVTHPEAIHVLQILRGNKDKFHRTGTIAPPRVRESGRCIFAEVLTAQKTAREWFQASGSFQERLAFVRCLSKENQQYVIFGFHSNQRFSSFLQQFDDKLVVLASNTQNSVLCSSSMQVTSVYVTEGGDGRYYAHQAITPWEQLIDENRRLRERNRVLEDNEHVLRDGLQRISLMLRDK